MVATAPAESWGWNTFRFAAVISCWIFLATAVLWERSEHEHVNLADGSARKPSDVWITTDEWVPPEPSKPATVTNLWDSLGFHLPLGLIIFTWAFPLFPLFLYLHASVTTRDAATFRGYDLP